MLDEYKARLLLCFSPQVAAAAAFPAIAHSLRHVQCLAPQQNLERRRGAWLQPAASQRPQTLFHQLSRTR